MLTVAIGSRHTQTPHMHTTCTPYRTYRDGIQAHLAQGREREGEGERKRGCSAHGTIRVHLRHTVLSGFAPYLPIRVCCYLRAEEHPLQYAEGAYGHLVHHELRVGRKGKGSP
jgi:hypothetical protein